MLRFVENENSKGTIAPSKVIHFFILVVRMKLARGMIEMSLDISPETPPSVPARMPPHPHIVSGADQHAIAGIATVRVLPVGVRATVVAPLPGLRLPDLRHFRQA